MDKKYFNKIYWTAIEDKLPDANLGAYLINGHKWIGIGIWENGEGWTSGFFGEFPYGDKGEYLGDSGSRDRFLNQEVKFWADLPNYPLNAT